MRHANRVGDEDSGIVVFDRTADGDVAPKRRISGANTTLPSMSDVALAR